MKRSFSFLLLIVGVAFWGSGLPVEKIPHTHYEGYKYYNAFKKVPVIICLEGDSARTISYKGEHLENKGNPLRITRKIEYGHF